MGANGILGAGAPLVCGAALAAKYRGKGEVAISFVGDGASQPGHLPREPEPRRGVEPAGDLRRREQRLRRSRPRATTRVAVDSYVDRAAGFGLPGVTVDGIDFFAVYEAAGEIIKRAREGGGPALLECKMMRFYGHFEGDAQTYRAHGRARRHPRQQGLHQDVRRSASPRPASSAAAELEAIDHEVLGADRGCGRSGQGRAAAHRGRPARPTSMSATDRRRHSTWHARSACGRRSTRRSTRRWRAIRL